MIYYASRTGTRRNLEAMRSAGFRILVSSAFPLRTEGFPYGLDNGKWSAFQSGQPWDQAKFEAMVEKLGAGADWLVVPDVVGEGPESLALSAEWLPRLLGRCPLLLIAVQDGQTPYDLAPLVSSGVGIFLGGSTEWKLRTMPMWGEFAHDVGCHFHVGRVNTARRMALAIAAGAHSADGSSASRFAKTVSLLNNAQRQGDLLAPAAMAAP